MARVAPALKNLLDRPAAERRLGPFLLVEQLGRGGFAPVWLAREVYGSTELRAAAVKLFSLERDDRIFEEARALCRVEHPHVVRFYALPVDAEAGVMGLAMEHVAGTPLHERLAREGRLSVQATLSVGAAIGWALAAVHEAGLVHRDVKPGNVIEAAGVYKLIDFGIAAADAPDSAAPPVAPDAPSPFPRRIPDLSPEARGTRLSELGRPETGSLEGASASTVPFAVPCGTVGYIDPAVIALGEKATPASDLYALGAMLFECLTGALPAAAAAAGGRPREAALRGEVLDGRVKPPSLGEVAPEAPKSLVRLVDALLAPDRHARPASAERVARELERIKAELAGHGRPLPPESVGPFRGLDRFGEGDRGVYFGRSSEIAAALTTLRDRGVVALVGPSGSGKSSLARAGVLPAIAEGALGGWPARWDTVAFEPGVDPRAAASAALAPLLPGIPRPCALSPEALVGALAARAQATDLGVVLLVDQLEELATLAEPGGRAFLVELLARLGEQAIPGVRAVVAARRDLLDPLLGLGPLGKTLMRGAVLIEPMTYAVWGDVLDQALAAYGYAFEDDALRDELLAELAGTASAMPLVQFALTELWHKRDALGKKLTRRGLREIGGLAGALERHADATLAALTRALPGAEAAARAALLALTTPQGTRATLRLEDLVSAAGKEGEAVIAAFERARLVTAGAAGVTLAHEALLSQWGRLRAWVAEAREDRLLAEELERDAARWRLDPEAVPGWKKHRLARGEELSARRSVRLSPDARAFLKASRRGARVALGAGIAAGAALLLWLLGSAGVYIRAVEAQEAATRAVLLKEQVSRAVAEQQTRALEEKQARIDQLLRDLDRAPSAEQVRDLRQALEEVRGQQAAQAVSVAPVAPGRERPRALAVAPARAQAAALAPAAPDRPALGGTALEPSQKW